MTRHREITIATGMQLYFCHPSSPWRRGSNEQTNGAAPPVPPVGHRSVGPLPGASQLDGPSAQRASSRDARHSDTMGGLPGGRCVDPLTPHAVK